MDVEEVLTQRRSAELKTDAFRLQVLAAVVRLVESFSNLYSSHEYYPEVCFGLALSACLPVCLAWLVAFLVSLRHWLCRLSICRCGCRALVPLSCLSCLCMSLLRLALRAAVAR